ncbi:MAG: TetR family transcriptional regulator [Polyangiaceae bacterium]
MGRPVNADAQATRRRILESARQRFAASGRAGASVRDIAAGAGVSLAMVNHYFGSKEGLYEACMGSMLDELAGLGAELTSTFAEAQSSPATVAERAVRYGWRFARQNRDAVRLLQRSIVEMGEVDADVRARRVLPFLEMVSGALAMVTGRTASALRLALQSSVFLVVRYAISSERELADLAFGDAARQRGADAETTVEEHLVEGVLTLLGLERAPAVPVRRRAKGEGRR